MMVAHDVSSGVQHQSSLFVELNQLLSPVVSEARSSVAGVTTPGAVLLLKSRITCSKTSSPATNSRVVSGLRHRQEELIHFSQAAELTACKIRILQPEIFTEFIESYERYDFGVTVCDGQRKSCIAIAV